MSTIGSDQISTSVSDAPGPEAPGVIPTTAVLGDVTVTASGAAYWRSVWSARHSVAFVAAAAALFVVLLSARQNAVGVAGTVDMVVVGLAALAGGVTLATYIPPAGVPAREHLTGGSCGIIPLVAVVAAPLLLAQAPATGFALAALIACYGMAAGKRITDHASC